MSAVARFARELTRTLREVRRYVRSYRKNLERANKADREHVRRLADKRVPVEADESGKSPPRRDLVDETLSDLAKWSEDGDALAKDYAALAKDFPLPSGVASAIPGSVSLRESGTIAPAPSPTAESPTPVSVASPTENP